VFENKFRFYDSKENSFIVSIKTREMVNYVTESDEFSSNSNNMITDHQNQKNNCTVKSVDLEGKSPWGFRLIEQNCAPNDVFASLSDSTLSFSNSPSNELNNSQSNNVIIVNKVKIFIKLSLYAFK
jgi:hypothetical protein